MMSLHLPKSIQQLLVDNLWWLAIARLGAGTVMVALLGNLRSTDSKSTQILLFMMGVITLMTIPAISPLMRHKKLGWTLFFLTMPVQILCIAASLIESSNPVFIGAIVGPIVGVYILLDIRSYYN
jgi:hypothetical protein